MSCATILKIAFIAPACQVAVTIIGEVISAAACGTKVSVVGVVESHFTYFPRKGPRIAATIAALTSIQILSF